LNPFFITILSMVTGALIGGYVAFHYGSGVGANAGVAKGFSAGACSAMEAARKRGLVAADQYDEVLVEAAKIAGHVDIQADVQLRGTAEKCQQVIADLQKTTTGAQ